MNWFDTSGLTSLAKTALKEAQKTIDKALDIQDESGEEAEDESPTQPAEKPSPECTAPTVLDTDEKPISPFQKAVRNEPKKGVDKDFIHLEQSVSQKMHLSENSSNDGSWSDRTLNADNDSIILEAPEEQKKDDQEDILMERLSDSSSFYNVNVTVEMSRSDTSAFVNIEKHQCSAAGSSESSQKDCSVKERTSPISSDSKSDLVKIGSDRTSGHTSGDELETATSSDIEIIPSPNGESHGFRNSPAKYAFKQGKFDGTTSPNLVDLVLGKSLATKIRGHNRELSEASVQSNTSDESQCSETDRLMRRLCEMAEILEARESRLMEVSRSNAELAENNADLKSQVESLLARHEGGDINMITEDYTQRMSALEKKFQQAIRDKDQLRKQLDSMKSECTSRKNSSELENALKEKDDVISQLQEEGEKLSKQQLQHSNIIKKLRAKEKDNEQVIKGLRDKIAELTAEVDRVKRSMAAKEELEVSQIEAVYRLTAANKKLEAELLEAKSLLDDTSSRLETSRASLEAARRELAELQRSSGELQRLRASQPQLEEEARAQRDLADKLREELQQLRKEMLNEEKRWLSREEALRQQVTEARELLVSSDQPPPQAQEEGVAALLSQLAAQQRAALRRDQAHQDNVRALQHQLNEAEGRAARAEERESASRALKLSLESQLCAAHARLRDSEQLAGDAAGFLAELGDARARLHGKTRELEALRAQISERELELVQRVSELETQLEEEKAALEAERKRNSILQEQLSAREAESPAAPDAAPAWPLDNSALAAPGLSAAGVEEALWTLTRRDGERRQLAAAAAAAAADRDLLRRQLAQLQAKLDDYQGIQEQYDALLQMYGEKEEQLAELRLDLQDVTQLYKAQLDELIALRGRT
ncbi:TATA element modulatory factor isoform X2 [Plodia interpunctella]|uniref:TATA element modulatory factor isoform X2 n=1 Tax=Plodia interpunctella TaxID=58824 RepID=UPI002367780B|nr:TATA element modulatory factor isoform X2 [Plodia interpunctella]